MKEVNLFMLLGDKGLLEALGLEVGDYIEIFSKICTEGEAVIARIVNIKGEILVQVLNGTEKFKLYGLESLVHIPIHKAKVKTYGQQKFVDINASEYPAFFIDENVIKSLTDSGITLEEVYKIAYEKNIKPNKRFKSYYDDIDDAIWKILNTIIA